MDKGVGFFRRGELGSDLGTEVVGVGLGSVTAAPFGRDHGGQHLPLGAAER